MKKNGRQFFAVSALACALASGCAKGGGDTNTLKVILSEEPGVGNALASSLESWAAERGKSIKTIILSHENMSTKFPAMAKNRDLPDLISTTGLHQQYPDEFLNAADIVDLSHFNQEALTIVGKSYTSDEITGVPEQYTTTCLFINKDAFSRAGIEPGTPEHPWSWEELYENARILQERGGVKYGFAADASRARYDILMYANGGSLVERDGEGFRITVNSPQNIATLECFVQANQEVMPKVIWAGGTTDNPVEYFKNGDVGILLSGSWNYNSFASGLSRFSFAVMPSPVGAVSQAAIIGGAALAVPKNAGNTELAVDFLRWLFDEGHYKDYLQLHKGLSVLSDMHYVPEDAAALSDFELMQNEVGYVTETFMVDESSSWRIYKNNEYRDTIKTAVAGEKSAKDALDSFARAFSQSSSWPLAY